jgi:hypothetical protein
MIAFLGLHHNLPTADLGVRVRFTTNEPGASALVLDADGRQELTVGHDCRLAVTLNIEPEADGFSIDLSTEVISGTAGLALHQVFEFALPAGSIAHYIPGVWVDGNPHTAAGAPSTREAAHWAFRDDRTAWPAVIAWSKETGRFWALVRATPATVDTAYPFSRGYRNTGAIQLDPSTCDMGAVGFAAVEDRPVLTAHLPFAELPRSYQDKRTLVPPVTGYFSARTGAAWRVRYRLLAGSATDAYEAIAQTLRVGRALWRGDNVYAGERDVQAIRSAIVGHVRSHFFPARSPRSVAGFYTLVETFGSRPIIGICEPGFTGAAFAHAQNLLAFGRETGDAEAVSMAERVFDTWLARGRRHGLLVDFWCDNLFGVPVGLPFTFDPPLVLPHNPSASSRRLAEASHALLEAAHDTPGHDNWRDAALAMLRRLIQWQLPNGGFARRYRFADGRAVEPENLGATPNLVAPLLVAHRMTGDTSFREAALRAGECIVRKMVEPVRFHGSTLDANCEDKEAATAALRALRLLHEATGDPQWLEAARRAGWMSLFWILQVDIPFPTDTMLSAFGLRTRGLTLVSTENNHLDVYLFTLPADLQWLAKQTGEALLADVAWETLLAARQLVPTRSHPLGPLDLDGSSLTIPTGLVPEVIQQTLWVYLNKPILKKRRRWIKGFVDHKTSMWTSASIWSAIENLRAQVSAEEWRARFEA